MVFLAVHSLVWWRSEIEKLYWLFHHTSPLASCMSSSINIWIKKIENCSYSWLNIQVPPLKKGILWQEYLFWMPLKLARAILLMNNVIITHLSLICEIYNGVYPVLHLYRRYNFNWSLRILLLQSLRPMD